MESPKFLDDLNAAYSTERKNVIVLTGNITDWFWDGTLKTYVPLGTLLNLKLQRAPFTTINIDLSQGLTAPYGGLSIGNAIDNARNSALAALQILASVVTTPDLRVTAATNALGAVIFHAETVFPAGSATNLNELQNQRLVTFLTTITNEVFLRSADVIILVTPTLAEINPKILETAAACKIEIPLPDTKARLHFIQEFLRVNSGVTYTGDIGSLAIDTEGLPLVRIKDLLEKSTRVGVAVSRQAITDTVNQILEARLGGVIKILRPEHRVADIDGYERVKAHLRRLFARCEKPETAVSVAIISGPNGAGKTYQVEGFAAESGRVVMQLSGIRGMYFGETEKLIESLRYNISTFGKVLIVVDEAHTAFGSVHGKDVHETEKRLAGKVLQMMSDKSLLSKVLWVLMTSRPDELDPDVKSRAAVQLPILDLEGDERKEFVRKLLTKGGTELLESDLALILEKTQAFSSRDFNSFRAEIAAFKEMGDPLTPLQVLDVWTPSNSIRLERHYQMLIAIQHCSYLNLIPTDIKSGKSLQQDILEAKARLGY